MLDRLGGPPSRPQQQLDLSHYHQLPDPGRDSHMWFRRCVCHYIEPENNVFRLAWPGVPASAKTRSTAKDERTEILTVPAIGAARWNNKVRRSGAGVITQFLIRLASPSSKLHVRENSENIAIRKAHFNFYIQKFGFRTR